MADIDNNHGLASTATPENNNSNSGTDENENDTTTYAPTTVLIMLGSMHFEHAGNAAMTAMGTVE